MNSRADELVLDNVRVFDGIDVHPPTTVTVQGGLIASVGDRGDTTTAAIDGSGLTLLPGLIDAHTHLFPGQLEQALLFGVTTALEMFGDPVVSAQLKEQASRNSAMADVRSAGTGATAPGSHPCPLADLGAYPHFPTVSGPGEAVEFVFARVAEGSDYLKLFIEPGHVLGARSDSLDHDTVTALVDAAHRHHLLTIAHATVLEAAVTALDGGVDGLTHVPVDALLPAELVSATAARGVFSIPTMVVLEAMCGRSSPASLLHDDAVAPFLAPMSRMLLENAAWPPPVDVIADFTTVEQNVRRLHEAGIPILAGSDAVSPGSTAGASLHRELELLVQVGLSPTDALAAATSTPARVFGLSDRGHIQPGMRADLVLVRGDPTTDITAVRDIVTVWRGGQALDRTSSPRAASPHS
jgi:imidazolonepropionase-like amidohydrolase